MECRTFNIFVLYQARILISALLAWPRRDGSTRLEPVRDLSLSVTTSIAVSVVGLRLKSEECYLLSSRRRVIPLRKTPSEYGKSIRK